jgi:hypothetical protein
MSRRLLSRKSTDGRMSQRDAALGHHLDQVARAQFKREVPPHAQDDDFAIEVSPFEEFLGRGEVCHPPPVPRPAARFKFLHQNPLRGVRGDRVTRFFR